MPESTSNLYLRLECLEAELAHLRQQQLLCRRFHNLRQRTSPRNTEQTFLARKVTGHVKWFNVKQGFGFIIRDDTQEDVFIYRSGILRNNPAKLKASVGDGESVEFDVVFVEGRTPEAINVTGPSGAPVLGSVYAPDRDSPKRYEQTVKQHESQEPIGNCCVPITTDHSDLSCDQETEDSNSDFSSSDSDSECGSCIDKDAPIPTAESVTVPHTPTATAKSTPAPRRFRRLRKQEPSNDSSDEDETPVALLHAANTSQPAASPMCQATMEEPSARTLCVLDYWVYKEDGSVVRNA